MYTMVIIGGKISWRFVGLVGMALVLGISITRFVLEIDAIQRHGYADFPLFWEAVHRRLEGQPLYPIPSGDLSLYDPGSATYKFPPSYAMFLVLPVKIAGLGETMRWHLVLQVVAYVVAVGMLVRGLRLKFGSFGWLALVIVALDFGPFFETLFGLQVELPIFLAFVAATLCLERKNDWAAGALLGFASALKIYPALALLWLIATRRYVAVCSFLLSGVTMVGIGLLVFGSADSGDYYLRILPHMLREMPASDGGIENLAFASFLVPAGHWHIVELNLFAARVAKDVFNAAILVATWLVLRRTKLDGDTVWLECGLLSSAVLLVLANSWANYQLLLLVPLAVGLTQPSGPRSPAFWLAFGSAILITYDQNIHDFCPRLPVCFALQTSRVLATFSCFFTMIWLIRRRLAPPKSAVRTQADPC